MKPLTVIENAISYIEENLEKPLSVSEIAYQNGYSNYYFQRLFSAICNISIGVLIDGEAIHDSSHLDQLGILKLEQCSVLNDSYIRLQYTVINK